MKKFKDFFDNCLFNKVLDNPSVSVKLDDHTLFLRFDSQDVLLQASYSGIANPWISSLCFLIEGRPIKTLINFNLQNWQDHFKEDLFFADVFDSQQDIFIHKPLELLKAALHVYLGKDHLYSISDPLVCRCFGVRESDITEHLKKEKNPTLNTLADSTKAGMGCRSCVSQLNRWMALEDLANSKRFFKDKSLADWIIEIDLQLSCFAKASDWGMEVSSFKNSQVVITYQKEVSQKEEEIVGKDLQDFLASSVDPDLVFFLKSSRHFSKAEG